MVKRVRKDIEVVSRDVCCVEECVRELEYLV